VQRYKKQVNIARIYMLLNVNYIANYAP